jgi:uncharacterized protein YdaU (DUF1376 family)
MANDHWMPLFVGDFLASTATWSGQERGMYLQLLMVQWSCGPLPNDLEKLSRSISYSKRAFEREWQTVKIKFAERDGFLINDRLEAIRKKSQQIQRSNSEKARHAALSRWGPHIEGKVHAPSIAPSNAPGMPSNPIQSNPYINRDIPKSSSIEKKLQIESLSKSLAMEKRMPR